MLDSKSAFVELIVLFTESGAGKIKKRIRTAEISITTSPPKTPDLIIDVIVFFNEPELRNSNIQRIHKPQAIANPKASERHNNSIEKIYLNGLSFLLPKFAAQSISARNMRLYGLLSTPYW